MSITPKRHGEVLQQELYVFYTTSFEIPARVTNAAAPVEDELKRAALARQALRVLVKSGWQLRVSDFASPADRAGIDFVWFNPAIGWYPLDSKATESARCTLIEHIQVGSSNEPGECGQLLMEDKVAFLELLVALTKRTPPLQIKACAPPSLKVVRDQKSIIAELNAFGERLERLGASSPHKQACEQWADHLKKAVGFVLAKERRAASNGVEESQAQKTVRDAIQARITEVVAKDGPTFRSTAGANVHRSKKLRYELTRDKLFVTVERDVIELNGMAAQIHRAFETRYAKQIAKHGSPDWLIQKKREFQSFGIIGVINYVLDQFEP
jgi:hypothetical protein